MAELDENLTKLRTSFDEIEKRIKAIERQVTSSTQLAATKACLEEIKTLLEDYQSAYSIHLQNYNNHTSEFNNHKQESNQNIADLQSASSIYGASINTLTTKANTIQSSLERLSARVLALEQNSGDGGSTSGENTAGATNWEDIVYYNYFQEINSASQYPTEFYFPPLTFDCDPGYVDVEMTFNVESEQTINNTSFMIGVNKTNYPHQSIEPFVGKKTLVFKKQFLTNKSFNELSFCFKVPSTKLVLNDFSIKIHAKNVKIFKRFQPVEIYCFNNNYYITDMSSPNSFYYGIVSKENFSYNKSNLTEISYADISEYRHWSTRLVPAIEYGDTIQLRTDNEGTFFVTYKLGNVLTYFTAFQKLNGSTSYTQYSSSVEITYSDDFYPFGFNATGVGIHNYFAYHNRVRTMSTKNAYKNLTLNNVMLTNYYYIYVVRDNNLKIGDPQATYRGAVLCRTLDNMFIYFPDNESEYCVEIAKGKNATAYYQPDGTIFVYINQGHKVFKYKLQKNDEGIYECIGAIDSFDNIIKYEELYDGYALVQTIDSWEIKVP